MPILPQLPEILAFAYWRQQNDHYTYSDARQKLASLLEQALQKVEVRIRRKDGRMFVLRPEITYDSPLSNLGGVDLGLTTEEIVRFVRESREAE